MYVSLKKYDKIIINNKNKSHHFKNYLSYKWEGIIIKITTDVFNEAYSSFAKEIFNVAYGYLRNKDDSIDIVQNVFLKLLNTKEDFKTLLNIKYYLIRLTMNECINFLKSKNYKMVILNTEIIMSTPQINNDDELVQIADAVMLLPDKYKKVIILHYYDSMKIKEIADVLKISESAVKKRLERARTFMKEIIVRSDLKW